MVSSISSAPVASEVVAPPPETSNLESKVNSACQYRHLPIGVTFSVSDRVDINQQIEKWFKSGAVDEVNLEQIKQDVRETSYLSESLDRQTALFAPNNDIKMQALARRRHLFEEFSVYNVMLICASRLSYSNSPKTDTVYLCPEDVNQVKISFDKVKKMLRSSVNKAHWPTNKVLFGAVLIYLTSFKNETNNLVPDQIDKDEFISRCKYVYRRKFYVCLNKKWKNKEYVRLQSLAAAIYFLFEFGHLNEHELSKLEKQLLSLYNDKVTAKHLEKVYNEFSQYCKTDGLLELRLEELMLEWTDIRDRYYQFRQKKSLDEDFPSLAPSLQLFFKSNAFIGIIFKFLNDDAEKIKFIGNKSFKNALNEWLKVYLDFSCLEVIFDVLANPKFIRGNTLTISELKGKSTEEFSSIGIEGIERAYYEALLKVIMNISGQINTTEDVNERINYIAKLADIKNDKKAKEQAFDVVDNLFNHFICQVGVFSTIQKDLKARTHWLELHSLMMTPNPRIEKEAYALLKREIGSHLIYSEELKNFMYACDLYRVMKTFVALSKMAQDSHQVQEITDFDNSEIFMKSFVVFNKIKAMLTTSKDLLSKGLGSEKLLFGAFLIYNEREKRAPSKVLNILNFNLDDFLNLCESVYINGFDEDLNDLRYINMQTMSASIYFLFESGRLEKLSPLEKFLSKFILSNEYIELQKNLSSYEVLYPFFKDKGRSFLYQISTIISFWEKEGEEFLGIYEYIFVKTSKFLQDLLGNLDEGQFNKILESRIKSKLSALLKLFIERSTIEELLGFKDSSSPSKISIDELEKLSDDDLEKVDLKEIERHYFIDILIMLLNLNKYVKLDDDTKIKLLQLSVKAGIIQYSTLDSEERQSLDKAVKSGILKLPPL